MSDSVILQTKNVSKVFQSGGQPLTVLHDISFEIKKGETCSIVGPSGSGKTTLLGLCAGLDQPTTGQIYYEDQDLTKLTEERRAKWRVNSVGFIFQTFRLIATLTALENVMVPAELKKDPGAETRAKELLKQVGLENRLHHYPTQLSGGEQQRVAMARAFINRPQILFADEPTGNLDDKNSSMVSELLFDLNKKWETTLILVTHNHELASRTRTIFRFDKGMLLKPGSS